MGGFHKVFSRNGQYEFEKIKYGLQYNWYAASEVRNIAAEGWRIFTYDDILNFINALGSITPNCRVREPGLTYWDYDIGATNDLKFNARGAGTRSNINGEFLNLKGHLYLWGPSGTSNIATTVWFPLDSRTVEPAGIEKGRGASIRLLNSNTQLLHGQTGIYVGNNGRRYRTICINGVEYMADNLAETQYRNGDAIPEVTDNAAWASLTTRGGLCAYNNDWNNV